MCCLTETSTPNSPAAATAFVDALSAKHSDRTVRWFCDSERVVCLQEWDRLVAKSLGAKYVKRASESLMAISILVYVRVKLQDHLSAVATSYVATGGPSGSQLPTI